MDSVIYTFYVGAGGGETPPGPVTYASHFNTTDGYSNAVVQETLPRHPRSISDPHGDYYIGPFNVDNVEDGTLNSNVTLAPPEEFSIIDNSSTILTVTLNNESGVVETVSFTITGDTTQSSANLTVQITNFQTDNDKYKANLSVQATFPNRGVWWVEITHNDGGDGIFTYTMPPVMYDDNANTINATDNPVQIVNPVTVQYSGVTYYTVGTQLRIPITIDNPNFATWPDDDIILTINPAFPVSPLQVDIHSLSGWNPGYDLASATFDQVLSVDIIDAYHEDDDYAFNYYDWNSHSDSHSGSCRLFWTYQDNATDTFEDFTSESRRVTSSFAPWDSSQDVRGYENGLIVCNGTELRYFTRNYGSCDPPGPNYTLNEMTGGPMTVTYRYYYRCFRHDGWSHSNGLFRFTGEHVDEEFLFGDLNPNGMVPAWKVELSLNGVDWYDCTKDYMGGPLNDGDGCRINKDSHPLPECEFTFGLGGGTTASTGCGWGVWIRITIAYPLLPDGSISIVLDSIEIVNWG